MNNLLERILENPSINNDHSSYIEELVIRCKSFIKSYCNLPSFPELSKGYHLGLEDADEDISDASYNSFLIAVNGSEFYQATLNLADCTSGSAIAAELQRAIRDRSSNSYAEKEVVVTFDSSSKQYLIESSIYGDSSKIEVYPYQDEFEVPRRLKISKKFGAKSIIGNYDNADLQDALVNLVELKYRKLGLEGMVSGTIPGGLSFTVKDIPEDIQILLNNNRNIFYV